MAKSPPEYSSLTNTVKEILKGVSNKKFTAKEIALEVYARYPIAMDKKLKNSKSLETQDDLIMQLVAEIGREKKRPYIKITEDSPRKYYYSEKSDEDEAAETVDMPLSSVTKSSLHEHDLYPLLSQYLWNEFGIYSKRIDEKKSSNNRGPKGNHWLHPDLVGMQVIGADWHRDVKDCVEKFAVSRAKLWSFEVKKRLISSTNIREFYFQTISNSSWANFGYLVAAEIGDLSELRMLSAVHGIGIIRLDVDDPSKSVIAIPAREKDEIDWEMVNRLYEQNQHFKKYINSVKEFHQTQNPKPGDWEKVESIDE